MSRIRHLASALVMLATTHASARDIDFPGELAWDAFLAGSAYMIENQDSRTPQYGRTDFPTQRWDDQFHLLIHGEATGSQPNQKEHRYRMFSNIAVVASAAMPVILSLNSRDVFVANLLTTSHTLLLSNMLVMGLKHSVKRSRPMISENELAVGDNTASFPSGHAAAAFAGATLVSKFFADSPAWLKASGWTMACLTALARVAGNKHYFTDVAAGASIGVGSALTSYSWFHSNSQNEPAPKMQLTFNSIGIILEF